MYERYRVGEGADFSDVVTAQQTLAAAVSAYLQTLADQWQAVAGLAGLLQADDLLQIGQ